MKKLTLLLITFCTTVVFAQSDRFWSAHVATGTLVKDKSVSRLSFPTTFQLFDLQPDAFRQELFRAVSNRHSSVISLPNAEGQLEQFEIVEASNFEPALQERFPDIRAFSGRGLTDRAATLKLSFAPQGVQTMVFRADKETEFIEPYSADHKVYAVFKSQRTPGRLPWSCTTPEDRLSSSINDQVNAAGTTLRSGGDLKTMRLAQSVTAEYSNYFGATSSAQESLVLAAVNNTLTRCNGVYERDLALHLNLVAASTSVFYYNPSTDPYSPASTGAGGAWNNELQNTLTAVIGEANYDVGHLFGATGGGGNAGCIGCVCVNGSKGKGFTSPADGVPQGDKFDIDYVVHEIGHQLGANHTFSMSNEGTGVNKEPGSGITIMGYAGITGFDLAPNSIDMYHQTSIAQIQSNLATKTCPITTSITATNATPVVAPLTNYTIPISTPFALTGSATDANAGDLLTYCWEQNDNASSSQTNASSVASATKATGPNWISYRPSTSPVRLFPKLSTILAGQLISGPLTGGDAGANTEALSSVSRTLNFRLTVRDNAPYSSTAPVSVGQTQFADMVVTVTNTSGPFSVSAPNTAVSWVGNSNQTVTWNVANTTLTPVSCANVKISLSTDGGQTFPTVLAANTPNDGSQVVTIPNTPTTTARIKVEAVGNIFFDISNANFTITAGTGCGSATGLTASSITLNSANLSWTAVNGATSYAVDYKLNSSATWTSFSTAQTGTTASLTGLASGSLYDWRVIATCSSGAGAAATAQFTTLIPCVAPAGLASSNVSSTSATVSWTAVSGATSYAVDYKLNSSATWISFSTAQAGTSANLTGLTASSLYDWRVSATCPSGTTGFSAAQFTTTATPVCNAPTGLASSSVASSTATVSWTAVSGAVGYGVDYKLNSSATWISFSTAQTGTSANLTGLTASSLYDWRVRTNCSGGVSSSFSQAQFTTTAAPACVTAFEPNESIAAAATINTGVANSAAISTTTDNDYFKITTTANSNITYSLVGPTGVDLDMTIFNSASTQIGSGATTSSSETVSLTNQAAGTYYIRVFGFNGANSTSCYTITATVTPVTGCQSPLDNSTNGTTSGAATIPFNTDVRGLINATGDIDLYKFVITTGGTITLSLTTLPANYDLRLLNSAGSTLVTSAKNGTTNETINYTATPGTYYARVFGRTTSTINTSSCYTLRVQLGTATRGVEGTPLYSHEKMLQAYPNPVTDRLNVMLAGYEGVSEIRITDLNGRQIAGMRSARPINQFDMSRFAKGIYFVKVITANGEVLTTKVVK